MAAQVVLPLVNPFDSEEEEVASPATTKPKKKTQFAVATTTTTIATNPFPKEDDEDRVLHPHDASGRNPFHHGDQGPVSSNVTKSTLRPCKSMAVNHNAAKGGKPESKLTKHMSLSSSPYTPFGTTTTSSSGEAPHLPMASSHKSTLATFNSWHPNGRKDTVGTQRKEVMGTENAGTKASRDVDSDECAAWRAVLGYDDSDSDDFGGWEGLFSFNTMINISSETMMNGQNLAGDEDKDSVVNSTSRDVFGSGGDADGTNSHKAEEVFGDYDGDDEYAPTAPSVDEFVNKAVADLRGLTLTQATTTTLVTKTVEVTEAK
jgi:hypothetical protein